MSGIISGYLRVLFRAPNGEREVIHLVYDSEYFRLFQGGTRTDPEKEKRARHWLSICGVPSEDVLEILGIDYADYVPGKNTPWNVSWEAQHDRES